MIEFACNSCHQPYKVSDEMAGQRAKCKKCGNVLQVPAVAAAAADEDYQLAPVEAAASAAATSLAAASGAKPTSGDPAADEDLQGVSKNFAYTISQRPNFALVTLQLQPGQKVFAEPSAMASMSPTIHLKAGFKGGFAKTVGRALGGESLIINTFTAGDSPGEVAFASGAVGDAAHYPLNGGSFYLQRGAFMLHSEGVELTGKWQGARGFFSGEGLVLLKASGVGDIIFNSYGAILPVDVTDEYIVDTGYIVAFEDTLQYRVTVLPGLRAGGKLKSFFFGGEGLVCRFSGQGRVWIQTRHVSSFLSWVNPFRRASK